MRDEPGRIGWWLAVGLLSVVVLPAGVVAEEPAGGNPGGLFRVRPYLQNPSESGVNILCIASAAVDASVVIRPVTGGAPKRVEMTTSGIPGTGLVRCEAAPGGLERGSRYGYQVMLTDPAGNGRSDASGEFRTLDGSAAGCRFVVFNDLHSNLGLHAKLCEGAREFRPELVFYNGDCWQDPNGRDQARGVIEVLAGYVRHIGHGSVPLGFVMGNHEWRGSFSGRLGYLFATEHLDPAADRYEQRREFALTQGPLRLVCMDTGEDGDKRRLEFAVPRERQSAWLEEEIGKPEFREARWRVLMMHIPLWGSKWNDRVGGYWRDTILAADPPFDLMICGHTHRPVLLPADGRRPFPVLIGGGSNDASGTHIRVDAGEARLRAEIRDSGNRVIESLALEGREGGG